MSDTTKKGLVPVLRFPEFRDAGEWKQLSIGDKVDLLSGYPFKSEEISEDASGIPLMRGINITEGHIRHSRDIDRFFLGDTQKLEKYFLQNNDLVIAMDGSKVGKNSALITDKDSGALLIQRVARLRTECKATISFIFQHIHSIKFHSYVDRINTSSGIPHISAKQINEFEICFPPVEKEQQKIADCLSSIDELVTAQTQKIEALKAHKKGLMQQLFPAEGETLPKLRFPEFRDAGEWEETILGKLVDIRSGFSPSRYNLFRNANYAFLKVEDLNNCEKYQRQSREYSNDADGLVPAYSVIFPKRGAAILLNKVRINIQEVLMDTNLMAITPNQKILVEFLYYKIVSKGLFKIADTSTIPQINNKHIQPYPILIPSKPEQQKIANCLSSIDDLITAQTQKLAVLKTHKKGLMQQLFPSLDEVAV